MFSSQMSSVQALCLIASIFITQVTSLVHRATPIPTAQVTNGTLAGLYSPGYEQDFFLGIPFAEPPVGDLRFRQAQSFNSTWNGTRDATAYSPNCIGYGSDVWANNQQVSEDCLTLNVIRPAGTTSDDKLPVALWIYGGGLYEGGAADPRYNLSFIVQQSTYARSPMIAVSINYRLQAWGFLFGQEILDAGSSNMGIHDQRLALQWVKENIAAFGGDPSKVTIWGESAGGSSIGVHLTAYGGRDDHLFRGAILESGAPKGSYATVATSQPTYDNITQAANCSTANDTLACLRTVPVDTLSAIFNGSATASSSWSQQVDNDLITGSGTDQLRNGQFIKVPILLGRNHDEGTSFGPKGIDTDAQFLAYLSDQGYDNTTSAILAALYPDIPAIGIPTTLPGRPAKNLSLGQQWKRTSAFAGDFRQHGARRLQSQAWAKHNVTSYSYVFDVLPAGTPNYDGAAHFTEVAFMMHNTMGLGYMNAVASNPFGGVPESYFELATLMSRMWVSFVTDLDPGNYGGCVKWPAYTTDNPRNIVFDTNVTDQAYIAPDTYRTEAINYVMTLL